ncbi:MAG: hypothetical protein JSV36_05585 [Anaerolineae bacterium]|nr:MAG: hypothetical protein JSV36_05585 [Anaerolineae bacterium]
MDERRKQTPSADIARIVESARRLGVEMDETEAIQWLTAMAAAQSGGDIAVDARSGIFGHRVAMLDFSPEELVRFREIGQLVGFADQAGVVETALALSGSAAQSKIQTYPGDCDFFERVNIKADSREAACRILADLMRQKALDTFKGPTYQLIEVKFGSYPHDVIKDGQLLQAGASVSWTPEEVRSDQIDAFRPDGTPATIRWDEVALDPGWCKLDWVVADPIRGQVTNASNMLDVTWEAADGTITPLDGYLDPYFQEVYLEAEAIPIFSKLARHVSADALDDYVSALEAQIQKYLTEDVNYGKAAKRMYNVFRLTGRYTEAAFVRELFDEPATVLYQVWSLIRTLDDAVRHGSSIPMEHLVGQADQLIMDVVRALEGNEEAEIVRRLLRLRDSLTRQKGGQGLSVEAKVARTEVINVVNNFFHERLTGLPSIKRYMEAFQE